MANRSKILDKSNTSSVNGHSGNREMEYFWSVVLNNERRSVTWLVSDSTEDDDEEDMEHTLFLKAVVLGGNAVAGEQNVIVFQSTGQDGKVQKGAIANLTRGLNPMTPLDLAIPGKIGGTFILGEGSGPVTIAGNHLLEYRADDLMDDTRGDGDITVDEEEIDENNDDNEGEEDSEGEDVKNKKGTKGKATPKTTKPKQKAKMDVDDDDDQSEEDDEDKEDDDDDDDDEDYDDAKTKKAKKGKVAAKKGDKRKMKPEKESGKRITKTLKK